MTTSDGIWTAEGFSGLPTRALRVRRLRSGSTLAVIALTLVVIDLVTRWLSDGDLPLVPLAIPALVLLAILAVWWPWTRMSWKAWGWKLDGATFQTRSGVYTKVWKGVPRDRVQFVEVTAGPLQRSAGLATLVIRTAGVRTPAVNVVDLDSAVAEDLRDRLSPPGAGAPPPSPEALER